VLMRLRLLKPLGNPAQNGRKYFCTAEILELVQNREWLEKATRAVIRFQKERNQMAASRNGIRV